MEFRDYAARETSALVGRVTTAVSEKSAHDLQALRKALDAVVVAVDAALANQPRADCEKELAALAGRLAADAATRTDTASEQIRKQAQAAIDQLRTQLKTQSTQNDALTTSLKEARAEAERLRAEIQAQAKQADAASRERARLEDAHKRTEAARLEIERALGKAREESVTVVAQRDQQKAQCEKLASALSVTTTGLQAAEAQRNEQKAQSEKLASVLSVATTAVQTAEAQRNEQKTQSEKLASALSVATAGLQAAEAQRKDALVQAKTIAAELDTLRRADQQHQGACRTLQEKLDAASAEAATSRQRAEAVAKELERVRAQAGVRTAHALEEAEARSGQQLAAKVEAIRGRAIQLLGGVLERLLALGPNETGNATVDDVLAAMVDAMVVQFPRVALFRVQNTHLEGVRQVGFDLREDISQVLIPRTLDSLVTHAVLSADIETRAAGEPVDTPFGGTPDFALALPIVIDDEPVAVVYADDSGQTEREFAQPELRLNFARLLRYQAAPLLARLAAEAKTLAELDEYATLLVNELEQTYKVEAKGNARTGDADRRAQMKEDLDYGRRLFAERAAPEGPRAADLLERRLLAVCDARADTPFGRDLAALIGARKRGGRASSGSERQAGQATGTGAP